MFHILFFNIIVFFYIDIYIYIYITKDLFILFYYYYYCCIKANTRICTNPISCRIYQRLLFFFLLLSLFFNDIIAVVIVLILIIIIITYIIFRRIYTRRDKRRFLQRFVYVSNLFVVCTAVQIIARI